MNELLSGEGILGKASWKRWHLNRMPVQVQR